MDRVTWTLHRVAPYANPADGKFNPIHGEERMFSHERETIDFATITYGEPDPYARPSPWSALKPDWRAAR